MARRGEGEAFQMFPRYVGLAWRLRLLLQIGMQATCMETCIGQTLPEPLVLAGEADTLFATRREQQNTAWRAISEAWKASWTEPHRRTNSGCLSVVHDPITRRAIQPTDHGRGGLCLSNAELRLRRESRVDSVVAHTVTQISSRSVNPANEEFS